MISKKERELNWYALSMARSINACKRKGSRLYGKKAYYFRKQLEGAIRRGADLDKFEKYLYKGRW